MGSSMGGRGWGFGVFFVEMGGSWGGGRGRGRGWLTLLNVYAVVQLFVLPVPVAGNGVLTRLLVF